MTVATTTHRMLFLAEPMSLPLLNVQVPLSSFYVLAPILLVVLHFYEFVQLRAMSDKIEALADVALEEAAGDCAALRGALLRLDSFPIAQLVIVRYLGGTCMSLRIMASSTLLLAPLGLLIWMEIQFLPFHSVPTLLLHLFLIATDVGLLFCFGIRRGEVAAAAGDIWRLVRWPVRVWRRFSQQPRFGRLHYLWDFIGLRWLHPRLVWSAYTQPVWKLHPVQRQVRRLTKLGLLGVFVFQCVSVSALPLIVVDGFNTANWPALMLYDEDFVPERGETLASLGHTRVLPKRDLRNANLARANLRKVDFYAADLTGANLYGATLQGATLQSSKLDGVFAEEAQLQGANLDGASLRSADFQNANLQGALLSRIRAVGIVLRGAQLQGAWVGGTNATMVGADLSDAGLQGVDFHSLNLSGASFSGAKLQAAAFGVSALDIVMMSGAQFDHSNVWNATVLHADGLTPDQLDATYGPIGVRPLDVSDVPPAAPGYPARITWDDWVSAWVNAVPRDDLRSQAQLRLLRLRGIDAGPTRSDLLHPTPLLDLLVRMQPPSVDKVREHMLAMACDPRYGPDVPLGLRTTGKRMFGRQFDIQLLSQADAGSCPNALNLRRQPGINVVNSIF